MSEFVRICAKADLPQTGEAREIVAGDKVLCLANVDGGISAMDNICPIARSARPGMIEGSKVICPWHAWAFDVKTGAAEHTPMARVDVYEVKIEGDDVLAKL